MNNIKILAAILALFVASATLTEGISLARIGSELRCHCRGTESRRIPTRNIKEVKLTESGPHCKNVEVIATLHNGKQICLEPSAKWVKVIINAMLNRPEANTGSQL
ncbi:interleukin-8-like [Elgaria multicarinata webbii]|uniref:interleukin-8-like n=1 Tax=Elgaria multicarinata webbii TaxID=159646 RepID=UPI002FCD69FD